MKVTIKLQRISKEEFQTLRGDLTGVPIYFYVECETGTVHLYPKPISDKVEIEVVVRKK